MPWTVILGSLVWDGQPKPLLDRWLTMCWVAGRTLLPIPAKTSWIDSLSCPEKGKEGGTEYLGKVQKTERSLPALERKPIWKKGTTVVPFTDANPKPFSVWLKIQHIPCKMLPAGAVLP